MNKKKNLIIAGIIGIVTIGVIVSASILLGENTAKAPEQTVAPQDSQSTATPQNDTNTSAPENSTSTQDKSKTDGATQDRTTSERPVQEKPTFMYFISASDEKAEETNTILKDLQKKYKDKVTFDIRSVDENPEYKTQFSIIQTPTLYLLKTDGEFASILMGFSDQDTLEQAILKVIN